jgi:hypothetical protein
VEWFSDADGNRKDRGPRGEVVSAAPGHAQPRRFGREQRRLEPVQEAPIPPRSPSGARSIWRAKWLILLAAIVAGGLAYGASQLMNETFRSSTIVRVSVAPGSSSSQDAIGASNDLSQQYAQLVTSDAVVERASKALGIPASELSGQVSSGTVQDQNLVRIEATAHTGAEAIRRTEAVANAFTTVVTRSNERQARQYRRTLERPLRSLDRDIARMRDDISEASTADRKDRLRDSLNLLLTERSRQAADVDQAVAAVLPAIDPVSRATAAAQIQPKPKLYTIGAAIIAALVAAQIAVAVRRP